MPILEGKSVVKYFGGLVAAAYVDFHVDQGEIVGLIGPNGAGKTTLFNLISGSLAPTSGSIGFKGEDITGLKPHQICRRGIARTFQLVKLFGNMTVLENVLFGSLFGKSMTSARSRAETESSELLEFVGLSGMDHILAKELSLANQKRLEIARAMATKAELLLLDEVIDLVRCQLVRLGRRLGAGPAMDAGQVAGYGRFPGDDVRTFDSRYSFHN